MSIWTRLRDAISALASGEPLSTVFDRIVDRPPESTVAFTIAAIALSAKMAKADGKVTRDEIAAFREIFHIPKSDEVSAARVYNLARTDIAGFDHYAAQIARMFRERPEALHDLLEGLVYIAVADGELHPHETAFLEEVARIFGVGVAEFDAILARHDPDRSDPYAVIGVRPDADLATIRRAYRQRVRELHPDRMIARGVPSEAMRLAEQRLAAVNAAHEQILAERERSLA